MFGSLQRSKMATALLVMNVCTGKDADHGSRTGLVVPVVLPKCSKVALHSFPRGY